MDNFVDERDIDLLEGDKYTFFVLKRLFGGKNTLLLSDHERLIICFSEDPFPVWIWTPDDASEEELERAYILSKENGLMDGEHRFNIKYELAEYFIQRAERDGLTFAVETNMFAYDNPAPIAPGATCEEACTSVPKKISMNWSSFMICSVMRSTRTMKAKRCIARRRRKE